MNNRSCQNRAEREGAWQRRIDLQNYQVGMTSLEVERTESAGVPILIYKVVCSRLSKKVDLLSRTLLFYRCNFFVGIFTALFLELTEPAGRKQFFSVCEALRSISFSF